MNFFKNQSRRENARTVGHRTRSARVGVEAMESKLLISTAAAPTYSLYSNGQLYEQTAGRSVLLASNVKAAAVTSTATSDEISVRSMRQAMSRIASARVVPS